MSGSGVKRAKKRALPLKAITDGVESTEKSAEKGTDTNAMGVQNIGKGTGTNMKGVENADKGTEEKTKS